MFYRVQSTIPEFNDEDEELQEVLKLLRREAEFQRRTGQHYEHGGGGVRNCLEETRPRGKGMSSSYN
jgi:hypothetical protein